MYYIYVPLGYLSISFGQTFQPTSKTESILNKELLKREELVSKTPLYFHGETNYKHSNVQKLAYF